MVTKSEEQICFTKIYPVIIHYNLIEGNGIGIANSNPGRSRS